MASYAPSLVNFRCSLLTKLADLGHSVFASAPADNFSQNQLILHKLSCIGVQFIPLALKRNTLSIFSDLKYILDLFQLLVRLKPSHVFAYTLKPVIYSGLLISFFRFFKPFARIRYTVLITGLGFVFTSENYRSLTFFLLRHLTIIFYRFALSSANLIVFQNPDDQALFDSLRIIPSSAKVLRVNGSGVDLKFFTHSPLPDQCHFFMLSRLLADKGVREFVQAARIVKASFPSAHFSLAGMFDSNPSGICQSEVMSWVNEGVISYLGDLDDVRASIDSCRYFLLLS